MHKRLSEHRLEHIREEAGKLEPKKVNSKWRHVYNNYKLHSTALSQSGAPGYEAYWA